MNNNGMGEGESVFDVDADDVVSPSSPSRKPVGIRGAPRELPIQVDREVGNKTETNVVDTKGDPTLPGAVINTHFMPVTTYIYCDEAAIRYRELDLLRPDWRASHRYRIVEVVRCDNLAEYWEDMGPSDTIKGGPINLIGGEGTIIIETYATMKQIACEWRDHLWPHERFGTEEFMDKRNELTKRIL